MGKYYELHKKHVEGKHSERWVELTWTHSRIVLEIAKDLAKILEDKGIAVDQELLTTGACLHDIGVYSCYDEDLNPDKSLPIYINHGFLGANILKKEGYPNKIVRFALTHTATGLTKEDIQRENMDVPQIDYIPISVEEELLCYADKFHTKYPSFATYEEQVERVSKYDPDRKVKMDTFRRKYGIPDLTELKKKYDPWNTEFDTWFSAL